MRRAFLIGVLALATVLRAAPYTPPIEAAPNGKLAIYIVKRAHRAVWCATTDLKRIKVGMEAGSFATDDFVTVWRDGTRALMVSNESEDAVADDVYHFDAAGRLTRMVRTGHYINDPIFS